MIITSHEKLDIGKIYTYGNIGRAFEYHGKHLYDYSFMVMREATVEEYRDSLTKEEKVLVQEGMEFDEYEFFYEISVD